MRTATRGDSGQGTVELALVLPVVALMVLLVAQFGLVVRDRLLVTHAAREGARAASVADSDRDGAVRRAVERSGELDATELSESVSIVDAGAAVRVEVSYRSITDLPFIGALVPDIDLRDSVTMRLESVLEDRVQK